jgi:hypothetical protein
MRLVSNPDKFVDETFGIFSSVLYIMKRVMLNNQYCIAQITNHGEIFESKWTEKLKDKVQQVFTEADVADLYRVGKQYRIQYKCRIVITNCILLTDPLFEFNDGRKDEQVWRMRCSIPLHGSAKL